MGFFVTLLIVVFLGWLWRVWQSDKQTTLDFDVWLSIYDKADSPLKRSRMAVSFLNQSINMAWTMGAINSKQREVITSILKQQRATTWMVQWLGSALPSVIRVTGKEELSNMPARTVGMLILLAWMSSESEQEQAVRQFLLRR